MSQSLHRRPVTRVEPDSSVLELEITDLSRGGPGVARAPDGRVIFVPSTLTGDRVRVRVVSAEKRYATAEVLELLEPSKQRSVAPCPVFGKCGGCQWQHVPYEIQWKTKVSGVRHALARVELVASGTWREHPAQRIWEYRNRVQARGFGSELGFHASGSHERVAVDRCEIARPEINAAWSSVREEGRRFAKPYKVEVEVLPSGELRKSWNAPHGAQGFRQVHDEQNEILRAIVSRGISSGVELWDLYGGSGNLSLPLLERVQSLVSVDVGAPMEAESGSSKVRFERRPVGHWARAILRDHHEKPVSQGFSVEIKRSAILDPPRVGLGEEASDVVQALARLGIQELVAVGCDADSWARDLKRLSRHGWQLVDVDVLDLFPQTPHVESIGRLLRIT